MCSHKYNKCFIKTVDYLRVYCFYSPCASAPGSAIPAKKINKLLSKDIFLRQRDNITLKYPTYIGQYHPGKIQIELPVADKACHQSCSTCKEKLLQALDVRHIGKKILG